MGEHFRAGWKKVGTFVIADQRTPNGKVPTEIKIGGNVAAYFCTPDLRVLNVAPGNVSAQEFLKQARHAVTLAGHLEGTPEARRDALYAKVLRGWSAEGMWSRIEGAGSRAQQYLAGAPRPRLEEVYEHVFICLLGETVSDEPVKRAKQEPNTLLGTGWPIMNREDVRRCGKCPIPILR